ncbi:Serine/threonine-protein kinase SMG1 [Hordeum vulgare]|nr:Serine/threonine-protein kinase SMG1 [Hordeum vulgare]
MWLSLTTWLRISSTNLTRPQTKRHLRSYVTRLPARKAPGPDGFTAEFLRACWGTVKPDIIVVFHQLHQLRGRGFHRLNQAMVSLLPKRADAQAIGDFRSISLIHLVAKVFAKTLSLRLAWKLDGLVNKNQNAFIAGRSLHDNFVLVRQSMRLLHQLRAPWILLKLDLARAFDTISWPFLFEVLRQYGFGSRFLDWLAILLSSACLRVLINGEPGPPSGTAGGCGRATLCRPNCSSSLWTRWDASSGGPRPWASWSTYTHAAPSRSSRSTRTTWCCFATPPPVTLPRSRRSCSSLGKPRVFTSTTARAQPHCSIAPQVILR